MIIHQILLRNPSVISSIREAACSGVLLLTDFAGKAAGLQNRKIILDIILQEECTCCKEIYFLASKKDPNIGMATVYRMINLLEEIGALKRKSAYRICDEQGQVPVCCVQLDDQTNIRLDNEKLCKIIEKEWNPADIFSQGEYDAYPLKIATNGLPEENTQKTEVNYSVFR